MTEQPPPIAAPTLQTAEHPLAKEWREKRAQPFSLSTPLSWALDIGNKMAAALDRLSTSRPAGLGVAEDQCFLLDGPCDRRCGGGPCKRLPHSPAPVEGEPK